MPGPGRAEVGTDGEAEVGTTRPGSRPRDARRAYYRVEGRLPLRITPLAPDEVESAVFELRRPCAQDAAGIAPEETSPLLDRLRRMEEKLDRLLAHAGLDVPRPLGAADLRSLVFSGAGLATEVTWPFRRGDAFGVELQIPFPSRRLLRAVGEAVEDSPTGLAPDAPRRLAITLRHMEDEERDALVAYSYELQRLALRQARSDGDPESIGETHPDGGSGS